jgi:hypothetical protein
MKITIPSKTSLKAVISPQRTIDIRVARFSLSTVNLEDLKNIDITTHGLQNNSVLLYDVENAVWVVIPYDMLDIDGGFY